MWPDEETELLFVICGMWGWAVRHGCEHGVVMSKSRCWWFLLAMGQKTSWFLAEQLPGLKCATSIGVFCKKVKWNNRFLLVFSTCLMLMLSFVQNFYIYIYRICLDIKHSLNRKINRKMSCVKVMSHSYWLHLKMTSLKKRKKLSTRLSFNITLFLTF